MNTQKLHLYYPPPLQQGLGPLTSVVRGDFTNMPFDSNSFDGAYAIEATCHAPKVGTGMHMPHMCIIHSTMRTHASACQCHVWTGLTFSMIHKEPLRFHGSTPV